jgi:hypothetical protein
VIAEYAQQTGGVEAVSARAMVVGKAAWVLESTKCLYSLVVLYLWLYSVG